MPKASRVRHTVHHTSVKLPTKDNTDQRDQVIGAHPDTASQPIQLSKKLKQVEKRQAFLQKLEPSIKQVSRSHTRRLKRKAREQLGGGLEDLRNAIATLDEEATVDSAAAEGEASPKPSKPDSDAIGKGTSSSLSKSQRKRVLELERLRHPLILNNSEFSSNPFQTIRTHAQNTIIRKGNPA